MSVKKYDWKKIKNQQYTYMYYEIDTKINSFEHVAYMVVDRSSLSWRWRNRANSTNGIAGLGRIFNARSHTHTRVYIWHKVKVQCGPSTCFFTTVFRFAVSVVVAATATPLVVEENRRSRHSNNSCCFGGFFDRVIIIIYSLIMYFM